MIIKLTDVRNEGSNPMPVYVNMQNVLTFNKSMNGKDTHVKLIGNAFLFVKETPEEIVDKMVPKLSNAEALAALPLGSYPFEMLNGADR